MEQNVTAKLPRSGERQGRCESTKLNSFSWPEGRRAGIARSKITQDVRDYAAKQGISEDEALQKGMEQKAVEFVTKGSKLYDKV